jgi:predicted HTH transcriptional regulator
MSMGNAFKAIGRSELSGDVANVLQIIKTNRKISEKRLMSVVWRDLDASKFDTVIDTLVKTGKVTRNFSSEAGVWFESTENDK